MFAKPNRFLKSEKMNYYSWSVGSKCPACRQRFFCFYFGFVSLGAQNKAFFFFFECRVKVSRSVQATHLHPVFSAPARLFCALSLADVASVLAALVFPLQG